MNKKIILLIGLILGIILISGCNEEPNPGHPFGSGQILGEELSNITENEDNKSCSSLTFKKFNLTNADEDAKDLAWLTMLTVQGTTQKFADYADNVSNRTLRAYI